MNIANLPEDSDSSDEDYIPGGKPEDIPSEVDSEGESEDPLSDTEELGKRGQKRRKKFSKTKKKLKKERDGPGETHEQGSENAVITEEEKKKQADDLWADFMKDTGFRSKNTTSESKLEPQTTTKPKLNDSSTSNSKKLNDNSGLNTSSKVKITQVFDFAGEEVKVEKEVSRDSAEARLLSKKPSVPKNRGGLSGIGNVLSQLGKKPKISTLEKTKLDWDRFKKEENIEEELRTFNKGKDGYLDRQDFLERTDFRRFEIERDVRTIERNKRLNNSL